MGRYNGESVGGVTVVERSLRALSTVWSPAGVRAKVPGLSWNAIRLDEQGALPATIVTWPGHRPSVDGTPGTDRRPAASVPGLADLRLDADLVAALSGVAVADLDDEALLDVAARWHEVTSWATAMQSRALGEIARRRSWTEEHDAAAAEISARLRVPQGEANKHMARGAGLAEHPEVFDALHEAVIDTAKADILLRSGNPLTQEEREEAIRRYLPQAPDRTRRWLRDRMNAFATRLHGTTEVATQAMTRRGVFLDPADNYMAWVSANLQATDAAAVWDAIDTAAQVLRRAPGATRTLVQARADALVAIATGRIIVPPRPECAPILNASTAAAGTDAATDAGAARSTGADDDGGAAGHGTSVTGTRLGVSAPPRTTVPASGCTCGGCVCGGANIRVVPVKPQIRITVPASMLLGLDDTPGHLDGYGPIPADLAARIATDATWQRLLTDPVTGVLTDYSTSTYQPGKVLRQAVTARDQTCTFPQCDRPARWADLDHIHPFDHQLDLAVQPREPRGRPVRPTCSRCVGRTTWPRPTTAGHQNVTPRPGSRPGPHPPDTDTPDHLPPPAPPRPTRSATTSPAWPTTHDTDSGGSRLPWATPTPPGHTHTDRAVVRGPNGACTP